MLLLCFSSFLLYLQVWALTQKPSVLLKEDHVRTSVAFSGVGDMTETPKCGTETSSGCVSLGKVNIPQNKILNL